METVFSHIIQKRFSKVNEDVATDALAFLLHSSEAARNGMMKLLRGIVPGLSGLQFRTQQVEGSIRPDMWGYDAGEPRVFVENKFWAGLTDNQPTAYLRQLARYTQPTVLLVIAPGAREQTLRRELTRRLQAAEIATVEVEVSGGIVHSISTEIGPILALTSWTKVLSALELEVADDPSAKSDLLQLRALCESADSDAFVPISPTEVSDQRVPTFILQLHSIAQAAVELAISEGVLNVERLNPGASAERIGRYAMFGVRNNGVGLWLGIHFKLWKKHGGTPFWLLFSQTAFGRSLEVQPLLEPWAAKEGVFTAFENGELAVAVDIAVGEDKDQVVRSIVGRLKVIGGILDVLNKKSAGPDDQLDGS
jgi:hypothetical protein